MSHRITALRRLKAWTKLGLRAKGELVLLTVMAAAAEIAVKLVPLPRLTRALGIKLADGDGVEQTRGDERGALDADTVAGRAEAVDRLYRAWPRKSSCLRRALVLGYRIRKANPVLWIGVAKENGAIRAHAWVEVDGEVIGEDTGEFAPLRSHKNAG